MLQHGYWNVTYDASKHDLKIGDTFEYTKRALYKHWNQEAKLARWSPELHLLWGDWGLIWGRVVRQ